MQTEHPYDTLTPDAILDAIESEGYICDGHIYPLNSYENRVYQVGIEEAKPLIAKFYRPHRWSRDQIQEEHNFCLELQAAELPVVPPIKTANNNTVRQHEKFYFSLFERKGGYPLETDNIDNLTIMGRFLGRMHLLGQTRPFKYRTEITTQSYGTNNAQFILKHKFVPIDLESQYKDLTLALIDTIQLLFTNTPYQAIRLHGDCHASNVLWRDNRPHFVDFDDTITGPAIQDLWMLLSGNTQQQQLQMNAILTGYQQFRHFNQHELSLIEALRTLRMMHYAAWLAKRWNDPAFVRTFTWFNTYNYWKEHINDLQLQLAALYKPPLTLIYTNQMKVRKL